MRRLLLALLLFILTTATAYADAAVGDTIITLGQDLKPAQKEQIKSRFNAPNAQEITVTNAEEHKYLEGLLSKSVIGTRAISSAMIQIAEPGKGIVVETNNITWVSKAMYENALATAGVKDAIVKIDAPFPVSGTAALTGIMKAYETVTGKKIDETQKKVANEEMVTTAKIGETIGDKEKAAELLTRLKAELAKQTSKLSDDQLREMIRSVADQMGLNLSDAEIESLVSILRKIQNLDIDWNKTLEQVSSYKGKIQEFLNNNPEAKSLVQEILLFLKHLIEQILSWFK
ncbi:MULTISPECIES: DUF1002 domain-containing protein [Aneurinibacillus]|uniref:Uncharacterized protein YpuA, DUF1002 family n=1 Tax=Aneurinibacillus thermoaerophilus TaxID=143495 RepID=A0A1G7ZC11_ANETH|nr:MULTISPECIES: DUF1002 domain-containing protein [Aneurinibacillus]AMA73043.1 hypothetical protein ACH33_09335 [Aneurinibacillus sp. XH2]MED0674909.1 DUF1002 domain-containing protein [Aneurinibacillus thermoaerophilus]MED0735897.1 DUF1002 domain-containing protein [Aneurinibacillus thermoaerophilus]MED0757147.1 DUF1002 domain-containing protein [Aneurinibacillus thermoaerophilus]MED0759332.1 DUF1002 domain-containing protein [Aneurinibacillus thermoaerophilus]